MTAKPKVSVIIPCYNRVDRTRECWKALPDSLPRDAAAEVIFVDNASSDETAAFLAGLTAPPGLTIRTISFPQNLGFAKANNQGVGQAGGEFVVLLNNDTVPLAGWLEPMLDLLGTDSSIGIVGSKLVYPDGRIQHAGVVVRERQTGKSQLVCDHIHRLSPHEAPWVNVQRDYQCVTAACMAMKRSLFLELGGFDEAYVNGYEDIDLCFRARAAGHRIVYCPRSVVVHHESSSQGRHAQDHQNTALFHSRWASRIASDEKEAYALSQRPNSDAIKTELHLARESLGKIQNYRRILEETAPDKHEERPGWRGRIRHWLGIRQNNREMARDIRELRNSLLHLKRVTEGLTMLVDYQDVRAGEELAQRREDSSSAGP